MFANEKIECMSRDDLRDLQLVRLKKAVSWASEKSAFYRTKFASGCASQIEKLEDIEKLPFTSLPDILATSPFDFLTLPLSGVLRISCRNHTGAVVKMYTNGDIARNVDMLTRALAATGVHRASVVGILGDMSDGRLLDLQMAAEVIGATTVLLGEDMQSAVELVRLTGMDTLLASQPLVMQLIVHAQMKNIEPSTLPIKTVVCLNEAISNPMRRHISDRLQTEVHDLFASTELGTAGLFYPCGKGQGHHVQEDYCYTELIEFSGAKVIHEPGRMGELVVTMLAAEAMPLIRYRTGQAVMRLDEPCGCGRAFVRLATPFGLTR